MSKSIAEILIRDQFKVYVMSKTQDFLSSSSGVMDFPSTLFMLSKYGGSYNLEHLIVPTSFVDRIVLSEEDAVMSFYYVHGLYIYDMRGEDALRIIQSGNAETSVDGIDACIVMYYEDKIFSSTSYYMTKKDDVYSKIKMNPTPFLIKVNEEHPANVNMANLFPIN